MEISKVNVVNSNDFYESNNIPGSKRVVSDETRKSNTKDTGEKQVNRGDVKSAIDKANTVLFKNNTHLQFRIHDKTNEVMVKIIDNESGEVLKEIPPEKMLDMVAKLWEIAGILVDEKR